MISRGLRGRTDFSVITRDGSLASRCRGIEISSSGIVVDRGRMLSSRDQRVVLELEIRLPELHFPVRVLARPIWHLGTQQALKFVRLSDADRLSLAEHVDGLNRSGALVS
jgi:hypothetical protein